jgi:hypothetical protein
MPGTAEQKLIEAKALIVKLITVGDEMAKALWPNEELVIKVKPFGTHTAPPVVEAWRKVRG